MINRVIVKRRSMRNRTGSFTNRLNKAIGVLPIFGVSNIALLDRNLRSRTRKYSDANGTRLAKDQV